MCISIYLHMYISLMIVEELVDGCEVEEEDTERRGTGRWTTKNWKKHMEVGEEEVNDLKSAAAV